MVYYSCSFNCQTCYSVKLFNIHCKICQAAPLFKFLLKDNCIHKMVLWLKSVSLSLSSLLPITKSFLSVCNAFFI